MLQEIVEWVEEFLDFFRYVTRDKSQNRRAAERENRFINEAWYCRQNQAKPWSCDRSD